MCLLQEIRQETIKNAMNILSLICLLPCPMYGIHYTHTDGPSMNISQLLHIRLTVSANASHRQVHMTLSWHWKSVQPILRVHSCFINVYHRHWCQEKCKPSIYDYYFTISFSAFFYSLDVFSLFHRLFKNNTELKSFGRHRESNPRPFV